MWNPGSGDRPKRGTDKKKVYIDDSSREINFKIFFRFCFVSGDAGSAAGGERSFALGGFWMPGCCFCVSYRPLRTPVLVTSLFASQPHPFWASYAASNVCSLGEGSVEIKMEMVVVFKVKESRMRGGTHVVISGLSTPATYQ